MLKKNIGKRSFINFNRKVRFYFFSHKKHQNHNIMPCSCNSNYPLHSTLPSLVTKPPLLFHISLVSARASLQEVKGRSKAARQERIFEDHDQTGRLLSRRPRYPAYGRDGWWRQQQWWVSLVHVAVLPLSPPPCRVDATAEFEGEGLSRGRWLKWASVQTDPKYPSRDESPAPYSATVLVAALIWLVEVFSFSDSELKAKAGKDAMDFLRLQAQFLFKNHSSVSFQPEQCCIPTHPPKFF